MITLQQNSIWSSNSWLKRQAVTAWSECTLLSKITIGYLQVSWNNSSEEWGRQRGSGGGRAACCRFPSHTGRTAVCFADLISLQLPPPHCWMDFVACRHISLPQPIARGCSFRSVLHSFARLPPPSPAASTVGFWGWSPWSCSAGGCSPSLGQPC